MKTKVVNVKVKFIRPGYDNLEEWLKGENNYYVGRHGRIFIGSKNEKRIFLFCV